MISQNAIYPDQSMARLLCIEDSHEFYLYLTGVLAEHDLTSVGSLSDAFKLLDSGRDSFDLILLDISLPDGNGVKSLSALKEKLVSKFTPIIVISSNDDVLTKVAAFGVGADDYIQKPPSSEELKARVNARLRSAKLHEKSVEKVVIGDLEIDSQKMSVEIISNGKRIAVELTPIEFKILRLLSQRPGQVFSRDQLIDHIWGLSKHIAQRSVDAHISHLRKKLELSSIEIETVLSLGYKVSIG